MRLDYADLISPLPFYIDKVGSIRSPTLKDIWNPKVTYQKYNAYISYLIMDLKTYCEQVDISKLEWYKSLPDEDKLKISTYDFIFDNEFLKNIFTEIFNFFFDENVIWNNDNKVFITFNDYDNNGNIIPVGIIHREIFEEIRDIILQRCGTAHSDTSIDISKVKNKRALKILSKIKKAKENFSKSKNAFDIDLPNLITGIAVKSNSINFINIWDLTIYQLFEHFKKEQNNVFFDIQKMSVAAYGNSKNTFKGDEWYKN